MKRIILTLTALLLSTPAWANVPNATPLFNQYNCNSSTTQFPYAFPITSTSDMTVYITDSNGNITPQTGTFSVDQTNLWVNYPLTGSPCSTGYTITLIPSTPQTQTTTYGIRTPFTATAVGSSFDKLTLISQQLQGQVNRALLLPVNSTNTSPQTFPTASPGMLIGWNGSSQLANINNPAAVAQWSLSGANISYNTGNVSTTNTFTAGKILSTGNVGINSTTPGQSLDVQGTARATSFSGPLTGNVTGTIQTAAQPNITSLGTLTSLLVSGNVGIGSATPGTILDVTGTSRSTFLVGSSGVSFPYIKVSNTQASGTNGGATTSGSWLTVILNTKDTDTAGIGTLTSNALSLPAGTYRCQAICPFYQANPNKVQARLYNSTASAVLLNGTNAISNNTIAYSHIYGEFTLSGTSSVILQYQVQNSEATDGQGVAFSYGTEIYSVAEFQKIS